MKYKSILTQLILLACSIFILVFFLPREAKFKYEFQEGKPWKYDLLTASSDFPIYKTDEEYNQEKDSVLKTLQPYYKWNKEIAETQKQLFRTQFNGISTTTISNEYLNYVNNRMDKIYDEGIISQDKYEELIQNGIKAIRIISAYESKEYPIQKLYTIKTAYESIFSEIPASLEKGVLLSLGIQVYLKENLEFDAEKTEELKEQLINSVSNSSGMVQAEQRIINRGEIVDSDTYRILKSMQINFENRTASNTEKNMIFLGQILLITCLMGLFLVYMLLFRPKIYAKKKSVFFLILMITGFSLFSGIGFSVNFIYIVPFSILAIIIRIFFDSRTALMAFAVTIFINSLSVSFPYEFILVQFVAGLISVYSLRELTQRSQIFGCAVLIFIAYSFTYICYNLTLEGLWSKINGYTFVYFLINALAVLFAYPLIYLLEKTFGFISSVTLVELSNINNPILRKLSEVAPGTFQHSLQVSNLATEAASKIGANVQLVRTGALYHDIGKISNPVFFTENQAKGINPHDGLPFEKSAEIIIRHVADGLRIAEKIRLPQQVKDFISTHHGKGKTRYFYNSFKNQYPDQPVNEDLFTYPGPNPFSKETALMMMADSVEAASRSLPEYNDETIAELVNRIINGQMNEGLLKNAPLSFKEIELVKEIFIQKLKTIYHTRISYPTLNKEQEKN